MNNLIKYPRRPLKTNVVYCADNLEVMKQLPSDSIDLIYIDPPFNTGAVKKSKAWDTEVQLGDFDAKWGGGINSYVLWIENRLREMHRLLSHSGVLCVHLDYRAVHYIKVCLDKIFGYGNPDKGSKNLVNEIIWSYRTGGNNPKKSFSKKHDTILIYSKGNGYVFNNNEKEKVYLTHKYGFATIQTYKEIIESCKAKIKCFKPFKYSSLRDVWEISALVGKEKGSNFSRERVEERWPTQKPIALLNRIIKAFSTDGQIVADFFCGCGTTISAAEGLGRRWIGCDVHQKSSKTIRKRMARDHKIDIEILQLKSLTKAQILKLSPEDFEKYAVRSIGGTPTPNSKPVDGYMPDGSPIEVKMHDKPIGVGVLDKFHRFLQHNGRGYIVAKSFGRGFKDEVARLKLEEGLDVVFITIDDIIRDAA